MTRPSALLIALVLSLGAPGGARAATPIQIPAWVSPACAVGDGGSAARCLDGTATGVSLMPGCALSGVDDRCEAATDRYDGGTSEMTASDLAGSELVVTTDAGLVLTLGTADVEAKNGKRGLTVSAMDGASGAHRWAVRFPSSIDTWSETLAVDGARAFASGGERTADGCVTGLRTVAFDARTGALSWTRALSPAPGWCVTGGGVTIARDGRLIAGYGVKNDTRSVGIVTALDQATGAILWTHSLLDPDPMLNVGTTISALAFDVDGTVLAAGSGMGTGGVGGAFPRHFAWLVDRLDPQTGTATMRARWTVPQALTSNAPANSPAAIRPSADGSTFYVAGGAEITPQHSLDIVVLAFDPNGAITWMTHYDGPRSDHVTNPVKRQASFDNLWFNGAMEVTADGGILVAGYSTSPILAPGMWYDFVTIRFDAGNGAQQWAQRYGSETYLNWIPSLQVTPDGATVVVNGQSRQDAHLFAARSTTIAYDARTGAQRWIARYTDGHTFPQGLALSADGARAYVAASTGDLGTYVPAASYPAYDLITLMYEV